jgi:hypothetical protein
VLALEGDLHVEQRPQYRSIARPRPRSVSVSAADKVDGVTTPRARPRARTARNPESARQSSHLHFLRQRRSSRPKVGRRASVDRSLSQRLSHYNRSRFLLRRLARNASRNKSPRCDYEFDCLVPYSRKEFVMYFEVYSAARNLGAKILLATAAPLAWLSTIDHKRIAVSALRKAECRFYFYGCEIRP